MSVHAQRSENRGKRDAAREPCRHVDAADDLRAMSSLHRRPGLLVGRNAVTRIVVVPDIAGRDLERVELIFRWDDRCTLRWVKDDVVRVALQEDAEVRRRDRAVVL